MQEMTKSCMIYSKPTSGQTETRRRIYVVHIEQTSFIKFLSVQGGVKFNTILLTNLLAISLIFDKHPSL